MTNLIAYETLFESSANLPEVPLTPYSEDVKVKLLRVDPVRGQQCLIMNAPGGTSLGIHKHYGSVIIYTISGAWRYLEHDWVARAGDFIYETAGSWHSFVTEPGEDTSVFVIVEGALEFIDEQGNRIGMEDWQTMHKRYLDFCEAQGIDVIDVMRFEEVPVKTPAPVS